MQKYILKCSNNIITFDNLTELNRTKRLVLDILREFILIDNLETQNAIYKVLKGMEEREENLK